MDKISSTTEKVLSAKAKNRKRYANQSVQEKAKIVESMNRDAEPILMKRKKINIALKTNKQLKNKEEDVITCFKEIQNVYNEIEVNAFEYKFPGIHISGLFQKLRDSFYKAGNTDAMKLCQMEMDVFNLIYTNGNISHQFAGVDGKGNEVRIPDFETLKVCEEFIANAEKRLSETSNDLLKANYASILYSRKKHCKYALIAIDAYLSIARKYREMDGQRPDEHFGLDAVNALMNAFHYSRQSKQKADEVIGEIKCFLSEYPKSSTSIRAIHFQLLKMINEHKERFDDVYLDELVNTCYGSAISDATDAHTSIEYLDYGRKLDRNGKKYEWDNVIGMMQERLMEGALKEHHLTSDHFWRLAIQSYRRAGNTAKVKELEAREREIASTLHLGLISTEVDMTPVIEGYKSRAEEITDYDSEFIIKYLSRDRSLLPNMDMIKSYLDESKSQTPLQWLISYQPMDVFGHTMGSASSEDEIYKHLLMNQYNLEIKNFNIRLIHMIIYEAVKKDKLSVDVITKHLKQNSWLGKVYKRSTIPGHELTYDWVGMVTPALLEYFGIIKAHITNGIAFNPVLAIDSLALKIEGILREMLRFMGIPTFVNKRDKKGSPITQERTLDDMLRDESITNLLEEDDVFFMKYLLVEKEGLNIRHNVAHCLFTLGHYSIYHAHLLLLALLRLGKYILGEEAENESQIDDNDDNEVRDI